MRAKGKYRETVIKPSRSNSTFAELIGDGANAYLWIGDLHEHHLATLIGADALHQLAAAIVRHVPKPKPIGRPRKKAKRRNGY